MHVPSPLPPGSTIGILGGGQLGRMLCLAAARLGLRCHIYCPQRDQPASRVAAASTVADYQDRAALEAFASRTDVVTYEFENVPVETARWLSARVPVRPDPRALAVTQDRLHEKSFLTDAGIATADFTPADDLDGLRMAIAEIGVPGVLKTRRFGYDGKGQVAIRRGDAAEADEAWTQVAGAASILESFVPFDHEISVIVARDAAGLSACYEPVRNIHENHILARSIVPAGLAPDVAAEAAAIAERIAELLGYVGVMGVEMFLTTAANAGGNEQRLLVNEVAPRVHNSGHWTLDACTVSQFEQHVRAICGWPLGATRRHSDAVMENLLGSSMSSWPELAREPATALHLYDKSEVREGRKMGHVTRLYPVGGLPPAYRCDG